MRKYRLSRLKGRLSNGKSINVRVVEEKNKERYNLDISFWRLDVIAELKTDYKEETYVLTIEKYDSAYPGDKEGNCLIEKSLEFYTVEGILDYLDKNKFLKKKDLILEEGEKWKGKQILREEN